MENVEDRAATQLAKRVTSIRVVETFYTIQGEGALVGRPTVFVRTGGCDYRCAWCDTLYAVLPHYRDEWQPMTPQAIIARVFELSGGHPMLVTLSGGNPALQPLEALLDLGHARGCTFAMETQGSVAKTWFEKLDYLVLSPKPPSSGMETDWSRLEECLQLAANAPHKSLKVVVFDEADYRFAREAHARFPDVPFYLQPGNHTPDKGEGGTQSESEGGAKSEGGAIDIDGIVHRLEWLIERARQDGWNSVTILPQVHVLLWGNRRGV